MKKLKEWWRNILACTLKRYNCKLRRWIKLKKYICMCMLEDMIANREDEEIKLKKYTCICMLEDIIISVKLMKE